MEAITNQDAKEIKAGIVNIHRSLELKKLREMHEHWKNMRNMRQLPT